MKLIYYFLLLTTLIYSGCKKPDTTSTKHVPSTKKSPVKYLRLNGVDGLFVLSSSMNNLRSFVLNPNTGNTVDSIISARQDEAFCFLPGNTETDPFGDGGNLYFNDHKFLEDKNNHSYLLEAIVDTMSFNLTSSFVSNWNLYGSTSFAGFTDLYTSDIFPGGFSFSLDTSLSKSAGYAISLTPSGSISNADSIVYIITSVQNSSNYLLKVTAPTVTAMTFSTTELASFDVGTAVSVSIYAYNIRHELKNGTKDIYFVVQRRATDMLVQVKP